ncbi:hypothetical protein I4U23_008542 [Adineta vaga]|nr:hypothetical protein I4U23_008542 [Adineta vaga]
MSTSYSFSFGLLISLLVILSISSICRPINAVSIQKRNNPYYDSSEDNDIRLMIYPKYINVPRLQRSPSYPPRTIRNSWFRASTYQHMKPNGAADEKSAGDNLLRWG